MRRSIAMLLAVLTLTGTMALPSFAAETEETVQETAGGTETAQGEETAPAPDPAGTVSWENLDSRIREGSLNSLILGENISGIEGIDYDQMYEDLRRQLNDIANAQWYITIMGGDSSSLDQAYDALRDTFEDLKDGEVQADNADVVWQLEDTTNQIVSGGETLYITLVGLEQQAADGQRGLETIDRNLKELRLRQELGQVSQQTVRELEQTRAETVSQLTTLNFTIRDMKIQLQNLIGEDPTGEITLGALPTREEMTWEEPDYEADLEAAKAASWTLTTPRRPGTTPSPTTGPPGSSTCSSRRSTLGTPPSSPTSPRSRALRPASRTCTTLWPTMSRCWRAPSPPWPGSRRCWRPPRPGTAWA